MTFDNTFSTPISVLKFMYDTEKKVSNLLTSPLSNIISTFILETDELVVANETILVPESSVNVEPNANYLDNIVLVFKNYVSTTGKTYIVYSKITEIQDELFVVSVISTEYFNELSLNPRGNWISGNEYHINDIVNSNNALYICIKSIASSTTRPENDTQHFSLWLSAPTSTGSVTYDNTTLSAHYSEIISHLNIENGGNLHSIVIKLAGSLTCDYHSSIISGSTITSTTGSEIAPINTIILYPKKHESVWYLGCDNIELMLSSSSSMYLGITNISLYTSSFDLKIVHYENDNISNIPIAHLTINYME